MDALAALGNYDEASGSDSDESMKDDMPSTAATVGAKAAAASLSAAAAPQTESTNTSALPDAGGLGLPDSWTTYDLSLIHI